MLWHLELNLERLFFFSKGFHGVDLLEFNLSVGFTWLNIDIDNFAVVYISLRRATVTRATLGLIH